MVFAEKLAQETGIVIPDESKASSAAMSTWIDSNQVKKSGKSRRKRVNTPTKSIAPKSAPKSAVPRKRSRKRGIKCRCLPHGNKDAALTLGDRYRAGGLVCPRGRRTCCLRRTWVVIKPSAAVESSRRQRAIVGNDNCCRQDCFRGAVILAKAGRLGLKQPPAAEGGEIEASNSLASSLRGSRAGDRRRLVHRFPSQNHRSPTAHDPGAEPDRCRQDDRIRKLRLRFGAEMTGVPFETERVCGRPRGQE
jgi:hypothetical protein